MEDKTKLMPHASNNNAQIDEEHQKNKPDGNKRSKRDSLQDDEVKFKMSVRPSEDEFTDDEPDNESENSADMGSSSEGEELPDSDGSDSVVVAPINKEEVEHIQQEELKQLAENPYFKTLIKSMVDAGVEAALQTNETGKYKQPAAVKKVVTPGTKFVKRTVHNPKSPSDATIYASALNLTPDKNKEKDARVLDNINPTERQITEFIQNIRINGPTNGTDIAPHVISEECPVQPTAEIDPQPGPSRANEEYPSNWEDQAREAARKIIAEADHMKARVQPPKGNNPIGLVAYPDSVDDEFFHITCHVDPGLKSKIKAGQFVDLEKLLVKDHPFTKPGSADGRLGLFTKDGVTYFAPATD